MGIGASAGGLEALTDFFSKVPDNSGLAFVVIQHLDPTQKGMMPELLQRVTKLKVLQVADRMRVRPNCLYVIPSNRDMSVLHGVLHLMKPVEARGMRLPINSFFQSLAEDQRERAVGVVLSGMGSDGTAGLLEIKEKFGLTLVQEPGTAKFDAMPRSAIAAGLADVIAPAAELPQKLFAYVKNRPRVAAVAPMAEEAVSGELEKIIILLRTHTGHDFTLYRRSTLDRRVEHRMGIHQIVQVGHYIRYLQENPQEVGILFKELLIGVTGFFRDPAAWERLAKVALPALMSSRPAGTQLRAWVTGCSTGEEAFSLAMVFMETLKKSKSRGPLSLQIYATDLDKDAIEKARAGFFSEAIASTVSPARLARFFIKEPHGYRIKKEIRAMVVFAPQNLIMDPPFTKLDMLCCRNLLIYLTPALQRKILPLFHYALNPRGILFLGSWESLGTSSRLFTPLAQKERIFRRNDVARRESVHDFPAVFNALTLAAPANTPALNHPANLQSHADQFLQTRFSPPAVLVNDQGDVLYISGRIGLYLEPAAGKANWNVIAMARDGLRHELARALPLVQKKKGPLVLPGIKTDAGDTARCADVTVQLLQEPKELAGLILIVFTRVPLPIETKALEKTPTGRGRSQSRDYARELARARKEVQLCREEMQTSQEEQRSLNEELQSTNEELQSTNEELTTSKEEMQSLNEELHTVNAELHAKLDELSSAQNDMKNLLDSTDIATLFLDNVLCVRRFTLQAKALIKLIASDVGRPITDLASDLIYTALVDDAHGVLRTLVVVERTVATHDGRWFGVRIMPYRTTDNRIDGVVITFADVTEAKKTEVRLREQRDSLFSRIETHEKALDQAAHGLAQHVRGQPLRVL